MRKEQYYINKYGTKAGRIIYTLLQREAAHARWKDNYRKKLKEYQEQIEKLKP